MTVDASDGVLDYDQYLRVSELLTLQTPLGRPLVHDEMLFIILQQAQELWFKQLLHELKVIIPAIQDRQFSRAVFGLNRTNKILKVLSEEVEVMETLAPGDFLRFRNLLTPSSGFESVQFRELELVSGLNDAQFLRLAGKVVDLKTWGERWPMSLHQAFLSILSSSGNDPVSMLVEVYLYPESHPELHQLCEALSEYEMRFLAWRFHHVALVERVIGNHSRGTGGSSGTGYLGRTLHYRFFPELWETRNRLSALGPSAFDVAREALGAQS